MRPSTLFTILCWVQGGYYLLTGLWPLVSIRTFQAVTGRKTDNWTGREGDHWLVNTVAVLVVAIGCGLLAAAVRGQPTAETAVLAMAGAVGLTAIDVVYVARRVLSAVYLLDAVAGDLSGSGGPDRHPGCTTTRRRHGAATSCPSGGAIMANPTGHTYHVGEHDPREAGGVRLVYKDPDWEARTSRGGTPAGTRRLAPSATGLISRHPLLALLGAFVAGSVVSRLVGACCSRSRA